jgi:hypothetical protein
MFNEKIDVYFENHKKFIYRPSLFEHNSVIFIDKSGGKSSHYCNLKA